MTTVIHLSKRDAEAFLIRRFGCIAAMNHVLREVYGPRYYGPFDYVELASKYGVERYYPADHYTPALDRFRVEVPVH